MPDKPMTTSEIERNRNLLRSLKLWLKHRNVTQRGLAEHLEVSEGTVSKWLKGTQAMSMAHFEAIAVLLRAQPHELLFPPGEPAVAERYRSVVDVAGSLSEEQLEAWINVGRAMTPKA